uniref:C-type lectin domain-containing protein n=1 Tax=Acrobeloides nanus TaxID=290746 RepID=A0A914CY79_9BILA
MRVGFKNYHNELDAWIGGIHQYTCGICWTDGSPMDWPQSNNSYWAPGYPVLGQTFSCPGYVESMGYLSANPSDANYKLWQSPRDCSKTRAGICKKKPR